MCPSAALTHVMQVHSSSWSCKSVQNLQALFRKWNCLSSTIVRHNSETDHNSALRSCYPSRSIWLFFKSVSLMSTEIVGQSNLFRMYSLSCERWQLKWKQLLFPMTAHLTITLTITKLPIQSVFFYWMTLLSSLNCNVNIEKHSLSTCVVSGWF